MWAPALAAPGATSVLGEETAHHVVRVCRARIGDRVTLADGRGAIASAELLTTGRECRVTILARRELVAPPARILLFGAPEGERADWLLEKAVEFGATLLCPIDTERARWRHLDRHRARWERLMRAALGQCRRGWLPVIAETAPLLDSVGRIAPDGARWLAEPSGIPAATRHVDPAGSQCGIVGPAAGLADAERAALQARRFEPISLADARLRSETAAIAMLAWWSAAATSAKLDPF